jgi:hypothetical protein
MTLSRALLSWLVLLAVGFSNGALRQATWARVLPERTANQLSVATAIVFLGIAVWLLTRAWPLASAGRAWAVGALWCALTFLFESALGRATGRSWPAILEDYRLWRGRLWPLVLLFILVAPRLARALRDARARG